METEPTCDREDVDACEFMKVQLLAENESAWELYSLARSRIRDTAMMLMPDMQVTEFERDALFIKLMAIDAELLRIEEEERQHQIEEVKRTTRRH
jgi:hypothetical protein